MKGKARILLVDDDADFVESTKIVLESKPYEVIVAVNGDEGLHKAREEKPDLILLDIIIHIKRKPRLQLIAPTTCLLPYRG